MGNVKKDHVRTPSTPWKASKEAKREYQKGMAGVRRAKRSVTPQKQVKGRV